MQEYSYKKSFLILPLVLFVLFGWVLLYFISSNAPIFLILMFLLGLLYSVTILLFEYRKKIVLGDKDISVSMMGGKFKRQCKYEDIKFMMLYQYTYVIIFYGSRKNQQILVLTGFGIGFYYFFMKERKELIREIEKRANLKSRSFLIWNKKG